MATNPRYSRSLAPTAPKRGGLDRRPAFGRGALWFCPERANRVAGEAGCNEAYDLWNQRNDDIHEPTEALQRQDLIREVEGIYELEPLTLAQDRDNFSIPLTTRITHHTTQQLHNYAQSQGPVVCFSVRESARQVAAMFQPIRNFFTRR